MRWLSTFKRSAIIVVAIASLATDRGELMAAAPPARSDGQNLGPRPQRMELTIHPRAITRPALANNLLPDPIDKTPGNAAPLYLMACVQAAQVPASMNEINDAVRSRFPQEANDGGDLLSLYIDLPLERLPQPEVDLYLEPYRQILKYVEIGTLREYCWWELPAREDVFNSFLTHLNYCRTLANVGNLRTHLQTARHDYPGALRSMQTNFALSRDLTHQALIIQGLVATGMASATIHRGVETWIQQPDSPNLYWPLADLPRPFIPFQPALKNERAWLYAIFPELRGAKSGQFTADDWNALTRRLGSLGLWREPEKTFQTQLGAVTTGIINYGKAKDWLREQGVAADKIETMSVAEAVGRYSVGEYERWYDELTKWIGVPYPLAWKGLQESSEAFERLHTTNPLLRTIAGIRRVIVQQLRLDRELAVMQTVEAIRAYAAAHQGALPANLAALDQEGTPAPIDPMHGRPFEYSARPDGFTLVSPLPPGGGAFDSLVVEVKVVK